MGQKTAIQMAYKKKRQYLASSLEKRLFLDAIHVRQKKSIEIRGTKIRYGRSALTLMERKKKWSSNIFA